MDKYNKKGFTIIELVVVMAIFLFIIGVAIGIFISIIKNQKRILAEQQALNQVSYAMEHMSKALRMAKTAPDDTCLDKKGYIYQLTRWDNQIATYNGIKFINQSNEDVCQEFYLEGGILKEQKNGQDSLNLTSFNLKINHIKFIINPQKSDEQEVAIASTSESSEPQPRLIILLSISIPGESEEKIIQTTISRRNLNVVQE